MCLCLENEHGRQHQQTLPERIRTDELTLTDRRIRQLLRFSQHANNWENNMVI